MAEQTEEHATVATTAGDNWSEEVEDLISSGDTDAAIYFLESFITDLEKQTLPSDLQLAHALTELGRLYSANGFSFKADHLQSRALLIRQRALQESSSPSWYILLLLCSLLTCCALSYF